MRRTDTLLAVVVGALALFVGSRIAAERRNSSARVGLTPTAGRAIAVATPRRAATSPAPAQSSARPASDARGVRSMNPGEIAPVADADHVRAQIASATSGYLSVMLAADSGVLVRWPDRRDTGLRIWVQSVTTVPDWDTRYAQMARDAFADWAGEGLPLRFDFVLDSATADIRVVWVDQFPPEFGQRVGNTTRTNDQSGWLVGAQVSVAVHDSVGQRIEPSSLAGIVRHEAGHALGLGHSSDPASKMYPVEVTSSITPADRATLKMLYRLPPGSVR